MRRERSEANQVNFTHGTLKRSLLSCLPLSPPLSPPTTRPCSCPSGPKEETTKQTTKCVDRGEHNHHDTTPQNGLHSHAFSHAFSHAYSHAIDCPDHHELHDNRSAIRVFPHQIRGAFSSAHLGRGEYRAVRMPILPPHQTSPTKHDPS